jgi:hypothetical protein
MYAGDFGGSLWLVGVLRGMRRGSSVRIESIVFGGSSVDTFLSEKVTEFFDVFGWWPVVFYGDGRLSSGVRRTGSGRFHGRERVVVGQKKR